MSKVLPILFVCGGSWLLGNCRGLQADDENKSTADRLRDIVRNYPKSVEARAARIVLQRLKTEKASKEQAAADALETQAFNELRAAGNDRKKLISLTQAERFAKFKDTMSVQEALARIRELDEASQQTRAGRAFSALQKQLSNDPDVRETLEFLHKERQIQLQRNAKQELAATGKLASAKRAPLIHEQRWRRLSELVRDFRTTAAAEEARRILRRRREAVGPVRIRNRSAHNLIFRFRGPYSRWRPYIIKPGKVAAFPAAIQIHFSAQTKHGTISRILPAGSTFVYDDGRFEKLGPVIIGRVINRKNP